MVLTQRTKGPAHQKHQLQRAPLPRRLRPGQRLRIAQRFQPLAHLLPLRLSQPQPPAPLP